MPEFARVFLIPQETAGLEVSENGPSFHEVKQAEIDTGVARLNAISPASKTRLRAIRLTILALGDSNYKYSWTILRQ